MLHIHPCSQSCQIHFDAKAETAGTQLAGHEQTSYLHQIIVVRTYTVKTVVMCDETFNLCDIAASLVSVMVPVARHHVEIEERSGYPNTLMCRFYVPSVNIRGLTAG